MFSLACFHLKCKIMGSWSRPVILFPPSFYLHTSIGRSCGGISLCFAENIKYILASLSYMQFNVSSLVRLSHATYLSLCPLMENHIIYTVSSSYNFRFTFLIIHLMSELGWYIWRLLYLYVAALRSDLLLHPISTFPLNNSCMVHISTSVIMPVSILVSYILYVSVHYSSCCGTLVIYKHVCRLFGASSMNAAVVSDLKTYGWDNPYLTRVYYPSGVDYSNYLTLFGIFLVLIIHTLFMFGIILNMECAFSLYLYVFCGSLENYSAASCFIGVYICGFDGSICVDSTVNILPTISGNLPYFCILSSCLLLSVLIVTR